MAKQKSLRQRKTGRFLGQTAITQLDPTDGGLHEYNPGKPKGARHKATQAALALLDGEAEALTRRAVDMALAGATVVATQERAVVIALEPDMGYSNTADHMPESTQWPTQARKPIT